MGEVVRVRLDTDGAGALDELRGIAGRSLHKRPDMNEALRWAVNFYRNVDAREKERVENMLGRGPEGPRLSLPTRRP
jgi:hypothetical protein